MEPDYNRVIQRIIDILRDSKQFEEVREWRFGDLPEKHFAREFPTIYVTTADSPEVSRDPIGPSAVFGKAPSHDIITEFWCVILAHDSDTAAAQKSLYSLRRMVINSLEENIQLRDADGADALCDSLKVSSTPEDDPVPRKNPGGRDGDNPHHQRQGRTEIKKEMPQQRHSLKLCRSRSLTAAE